MGLTGLLTAILAVSPMKPLVAKDLSAASSLSDRGVFVISLAGKRIGSENFEIRATANGIEAEGKVEMRVPQEGKSVEFRTSSKLVLDSELRPLTYNWSQKGAQSSQLAIQFQPSPAKVRYKTVTGEEDARDFELSKDVVVLDDNVFHHYQLIAQRYLRNGSGKQTLPAFVPQEALPGTLVVQDAGPASAEVGGQKQTLRHLVFSTELKQIDLWVDEQGRVQRIYNSEAQLDAVRKR